MQRAKFLLLPILAVLREYYKPAGGNWTLEPAYAGNLQGKYDVGTQTPYNGKSNRGGVDWAYESVAGDTINGDEDYILVVGDALHVMSEQGDYIYGYQFTPSSGGNISNSVLVDLDDDVVNPYKYVYADVDIFKDYCANLTLEIGNYVWYDKDQDGIQDPNEPGLPGINVTLYNAAGDSLTTVVTDTTGEYYFGKNTPGFSGLNPNTTYYIVVGKGGQFNPNNALLNAIYGITVPNVGTGIKTDWNDSDATIGNTGNGEPASVHAYPFIQITTGDLGQHDHTYDFGFINNCILPTADISTYPTGPNGWLCEGESYSFQATDAGAGATYAWTFGPNATPQTATGIGPHSVQYTADNDSTAFYPQTILTVSLNNCVARDTLDLDFRPLPVITNVTTTNVSTCSGSNGMIEVEVTGLKNECFQISLDGGNTWEANNETSFSGLSGGSYTLLIRYCNTDCPNNYGLVVLSEPAVVVAVNDSISLCPGANYEGTVAENDLNLANTAFAVLAQPTHGFVVFQPTGFFTYTSTNALCGTDEFSYQVCDQNTSCCANAIVHLTFEDSTIPILVNIPPDDTISCDEEIPLPPLVSAFDNCPAIGISINEESTQGEDGCSLYDYTITRTWTATDLCGNSTSGSHMIGVQDVVAPDIYRIYTLPNGKKMVAGVMEFVGKNWKTINLPIDFTTKPLIFHQVATSNDASGVVSQIRNVSISQFELRIKEEENNDNKHAREDIAWFAIESGTQATDYQLEAKSTFLTEAAKGINFQNAFASVPALLTSLQTTNEQDPAFVRNTNLTTSSVSLNIQEEASKDAELSHISETTAYLAIENIGSITDKKGRKIGETGKTTLSSTWKTIYLNNHYANPVVIANNLTTANGEGCYG